MICTIKSKNRTELIDITSKIQDVVLSAGIGQGLCILYVPHTTAAVTINESADPSVKDDILMIINTITASNHVALYTSILAVMVSYEFSINVAAPIAMANITSKPRVVLGEKSIFKSLFMSHFFSL